MIKEKRLENKLTQNELANKLNINRSYLSRIENKQHNNITLNLIKKISEILDINIIILVEWLLC